MSEETSGNKKKTLGIVGVVVTLVSVFWFALRPRLKQRRED
jgi:hypothetical protein